MPGFDIQAARQSGYSDDEILQHLTQSRKFDIDGALKSGYSKADIITHLSTQPAPAAAAPQSWSDKLGVQNPVGRGAIDFVEGAASGAASTVFQGGDIIRRGLGMERIIDNPDVKQAMKAPDSFMGGAGKFVEQAAEFAVPATAVAKATKGATLIGRVLAEGATAAGVAGVQSGGDTAHMATAGVLGAAAPAAGAAVGAIAKTKLPERIYQSALKPTWQMFQKEGHDLLKTGLEMGIPVNANGMATVTKRIADIGKEVEQGVIAHGAAGRTVDANKVLSALDDLYDFYKNTAAPENSLKILDDLKRQFTQYHGQQIPIELAQKLKVNTYQELKTAYGEMKEAKIEGLKNIARGLKEQIETVFPEVKDLNAEQSKLLNLDDALYRALWRIENHQMMGIGSGIAGTAGHAIMGGPGAVVGLLGKFLLDDPALKSKLAITLARAGNRNPPAAVTKGLATLKSTLQETLNSLIPVSHPEAPTLQPQAVPAR